MHKFLVTVYTQEPKQLEVLAKDGVAAIAKVRAGISLEERKSLQISPGRTTGYFNVGCNMRLRIEAWDLTEPYPTFFSYTSKNRGQQYVRIRLHPHICAIRGQQHGYGLYYPINHSPEQIARSSEEARRYAIQMLLHLKKAA